MHDTSNQKKPNDIEQAFQRQIARKAKRRLKALGEEDRGVMFWLGMFGLVGWSIVIPTLAGIGLGLWIDTTWPSGVSWTLTLLFAGIVVGCLQAWYWIKAERKRD